MTHSPQADVPPAGWAPAPENAVIQLGRHLRRRESRRRFLRKGATTATLLAIGGGGWLVRPRRGDGFDVGGISCAEVVRLGRDYMTGTVPEPTRGRIAAHVANCPRCRPLFGKMQAEMTGAG